MRKRRQVSLRIEDFKQGLIDLIPVEKELGRHYSTLERLLAHPQVAGYIQWKRERRKENRS